VWGGGGVLERAGRRAAPCDADGVECGGHTVMRAQYDGCISGLRVFGVSARLHKHAVTILLPSCWWRGTQAAVSIPQFVYILPASSSLLGCARCVCTPSGFAAFCLQSSA
jgi:hypothetical protein